jgi:hypothetical protein
MKNTVLFLFCAFTFSLLFSNPMHGQPDKERQKILKSIQKELKDKPIKLARKEAKQLGKQGWYVAPGKLPLAMQLENSYTKQAEVNNEGLPSWVTGQATAVGGTKISAKNQAIENAKLELAGKLQSTIEALVENTVANEAISQDEATSLTKTITASKNRISGQLGRVIELTEMYRDKGSNVETSVIVAINYKKALEATKKEIRKSLEEQGNDLHKKLDDIMSF